MSLTKETIEILLALIPGFLFIKIVSLRCAIKAYEVHNYVIDSLFASLVIYGIAKLFGSPPTGAEPENIFGILVLTIILAWIWSIIINKDVLSKILHHGNIRLSTHSSIYPVMASEQFENKWHLIRYKDNKEIVGIVRAYNHETNEALVENGMIVNNDGSLSEDRAWYYVPSGDQIIYMRTIEEKKS